MWTKRFVPLLGLCVALVGLTAMERTTRAAVSTDGTGWQPGRTPSRSTVSVTKAGRSGSVEAHTRGQQAVAMNQLPVLVDGSKNPDGIPDETAYRHFIKSITISTKPAVADAARRDAFLAAVGLSAGDRAASMNAVASVRQELDEIFARKMRLAAAPGADAQVQALTAQEHRALDAARSRLTDALSVEGKDSLDNYIRTRVKPRVVIYGTTSR
jgi:hypothetical protein